MADSTKCGHCAKTEMASGGKLKRCAKCKSALYCSRECQTSHWKVHKKVCATLGATTMGQPDAPAPAPSTNTAPRAASSKGAPLSVRIAKPFHRLHDKTWLHGRSEQDVYKLLIDSFRLMLEDDYKFEGDVQIDTIYDGAADSSSAFREFLKQAEKRPGLLPSWWSPEKAAACDIMDHYGDTLMPMQLRMLREQITLRGPGGQSGAAMIQQMMAMGH
ncbi:hypothetical protein BGZ68_003981 [Mortierella alpina]|nr:hypothetical protein BGZ68_003981 [Mortierella alpina]